MIKIKPLFTVFILILLTVTVNAQSFEDFVNDRDKDNQRFKSSFNTYKTTIDKEFDEYKKIVNEEYKKYTKNLSKHWGKPVLSSQKIWVEYSKDMRSRKTVDFGRGVIKISVIIPENDRYYNKKINDLLADLLTENTKTAFKRDPISQNIERRIKKKLSNVISSNIKKNPIVTDIFFKSPKPSKAKVKRKVKEIRKKTVVKKQPSKVKNSVIVSIKLRIPKAFKKKARIYVPTVKRLSKKWRVDPALIMAIIQTESAFNPMAKSYVPAYGLMQIVPRSAGLDTSKVLFGKRKLLSPSFLFNGTNNINVGSCYVNILMYRYLKKIKNKKNRLLCAIASYNTGAGNVARAFIGHTNINQASKKINRMNSRQVYNRLINHLTHQEAVHYVKNITKRMNYYKGL
ncbi:MAG: DUF3393 domain-containing protein [Desulfobacterales bacterium]|nr:DUF3393 domain-containing protein [Desulfobacterales bacterium]